MGPYRNYRHLEKLFGVTWRDLVEVEPGLEEWFGLWTKRGANSSSRQTELGRNAGAACESVVKPIPRAVVTGPAAGRSANKIGSTCLIPSWPRYVPLPTDQGPESNWEDQLVY
jgi:hypothetical protein